MDGEAFRDLAERAISLALGVGSVSDITSTRCRRSEEPEPIRETDQNEPIRTNRSEGVEKSDLCGGGGAAALYKTVKTSVACLHVFIHNRRNRSEGKPSEECDRWAVSTKAVPRSQRVLYEPIVASAQTHTMKAGTEASTGDHRIACDNGH